MKYLSNIILLVSFWLTLAFLFVHFFPETILWSEGLNIFLFTPQMLSQLMEDTPGLTNLASHYIQQFFYTPFLGAMILSGIYTLSVVPALFLLSALNFKMIGSVFQMSAVLFLPASISAAAFSTSVDAALYCLFFFTVLAIFVAINNPFFKGLFSVISSIVGFYLMPFVLLLILCIFFIIIEAMARRAPLILLFYAACVIIVILMPNLVSDILTYIAPENRYPLSIANKSFYITSAIYVIPPLIFYFIHGLRFKIPNVCSYIMLLLLLIIPYSSFAADEERSQNEQCYKIARLAENREWNEVLNLVNSGEEGNNDINLRFALLAESELGTLPENLFRYPISQNDQFSFPHVYELYETNFNRLFYRNIGVFDEAFHQAFEFGVLSKDGLCFSSLRNMTDYAISSGDKALANKYLTILSTSSCNDEWIASRKKQLAEMNTMEYAKMPLRSSSFVGLFKFNSEIVRLLEEAPKNKKLLDYLLCGLLVEKKLDQFEIILKMFPLYKDKKLPKAFGEAAAMLTSLGKDMSSFHYESSYDASFADFYKPESQGDKLSAQKYAGTYWYYYMYTVTSQATDATSGASAKTS